MVLNMKIFRTKIRNYSFIQLRLSTALLLLPQNQNITSRFIRLGESKLQLVIILTVFQLNDNFKVK